MPVKLVKTDRNLRAKLAKVKIPMHKARESIGRKKNRTQHRPRRVIWESEKTAMKRYKYTAN